MSQESARPAKQIEPNQKPHRWWKSRSQRRRRHDFDDLVEGVCERLSEAPEVCRMIRTYASFDRIPHCEERAALHNAQCQKDQAAFEKLILSLAPIALRPLMVTRAFDCFVDDALQEAMLSMMEYLLEADVGDVTHWQSALGFVPMNARLKVAFGNQSTSGISYSRSQRSIAREFILRPELLEADEIELQDAFHDEVWSDVLEVQASMCPLPISQRPDEAHETIATSEAKIDAERLREWVKRNLNDRHLRIFDLRLMTDDPTSYVDCGVDLGLSGERVRQLEKDLIGFLREAYLRDLKTASQPRH